MAVCSREREYVQRFAEYVNRRPASLLAVHGFTDSGELSAYTKEHPVDLLLLSEEIVAELPKKKEYGTVILLSGEEYQTGPQTEYPRIYKYQSCPQILRQAMDFYAEQAAVVPGVMLRTEGMKRIAVYSPVGRTGKTGFALALGKEIAKKRRTLYLNLEEYSGFEELMGRGFDHNLSDLLYYVRQDNQNLLYKMNSMIQTVNNLDYIPPVQMPADIRTTAWQDWERLLQMIMLDSSYEVIVLDIGCGIDENFQLLDLCKKIYMPVLSDAVSQCKIAQFENQVRIWDYPQILEKIQKISLPFHMVTEPSPSYIEQLTWSELGDYVRNLLRKEKG